VTVACYYFGNYHPGDPRNEARLGAGWTEWELLKAAKPRFPGHQQPKVPLWGYEDESDPGVMARKIDAAADHGIDAFIFDWYHYNDGPFLDRPLDRGFFGARNNGRLNFALMWANHDWVDIHPAKRGVPAHCHFPGKIGPDGWDALVDNVVNDYFVSPQYWKPGGLPYFSIYELDTFIESFGGLDGAAAALDLMRCRAREQGLPGVHVNAVIWAIPILPGEKGVDDPQAAVRALGIDSVTSYVWIHHVPIDFPTMPYTACQEAYEAYRDTAAARHAPVPYHPNVTMGWDSSPRTVASDRFEPVGYNQGAAKRVVALAEQLLGDRFL